MRQTIRDRNSRTAELLRSLQGTESMIAGAGAGVISSIATCPLDVVKTKLQAQGKVVGREAYKGLVGSFGRIWREEGIRGLYRGLGPTVMGYLPTWAIYFTVYDRSKVALEAKYGKDRWVPHILAAMTGGITQSLATNPLWVIKTRFMTQNVTTDRPEERYKHTVDALRRIYQTEGVYGFYRGMVPSLFGVFHVAVQFPLYEALKRFYRPKDGSQLSPSTILTCSSLSKVVASVTCYPHEVLRTRMQIQRYPKNATASSSIPIQGGGEPPGKRGLVQTAKMILEQEGWRGYYKGLGVTLIRTVPSSAVTILTYELILRNLLPLTHDS
ncbi:mitochondrial carrier [Atractiella rhizophila]|nr:mitochondrial carrier [Atractiella rhizophila]